MVELDGEEFCPHIAQGCLTSATVRTVGFAEDGYLLLLVGTHPRLGNKEMQDSHTNRVLINDLLHLLLGGGNHGGLRGSEEAAEYGSYFDWVEDRRKSSGDAAGLPSWMRKGGGIYVGCSDE